MSADSRILDDHALDVLFREARTHRVWLKKDVSDVVLRALYDLLKLGPTSSNCCPARFVFVKSAAAKEKLKPFLDAGNVDQTMSAPVTAIIAYDMKFYEKMDVLRPQSPGARGWYEGKEAAIALETRRSGSLQGAYLMLAARSLGLDCGPMGGFDADGINAAFFGDKSWRVNFLCNLGYGDKEKLAPRLPRLGFDEAALIA